MFGEPKTLIVVYKDELLLNLFKKLIETNDDIDDEHVVGIADGSLRVVSWTEKVWLDQKKAGNINNKVLFLGKIKGWENLVPILDIKFNKYGIKYGWAGNQSLLVCNAKDLNDNKLYNEFLDDLNKYNIPDVIKSDKVEIKEEEAQEVEQKSNFFKKAGSFIKKTTTNIAKSISSSKEEKKKLKQQYFYGIQTFYENDLAKYINQ